MIFWKFRLNRSNTFYSANFQRSVMLLLKKRLFLMILRSKRYAEHQLSVVNDTGESIFEIRISPEYKVKIGNTRCTYRNKVLWQIHFYIQLKKLVRWTVPLNLLLEKVKKNCRPFMLLGQTSPDRNRVLRD